MVVGKGQNKKSLFQSGESIQENGIKLPMHNFRFQTSSKKGVTASIHVTGETLGEVNSKQVKRKSVLPATSLDQFLEEQELQKEHDINDLPNCKQVKRKSVIPTTIADDLVDQEEIGGDECAIDEEIGIDCSTEDTKKRMWEYINSKFLIPVEGKKWVMTGLRDAWRRHKQKIKERCFDKNSTVEDMLAKRLV
ncbi:hypothetical protein KY284_026517 [Solanum tuberosum]|nr:hypothetical protein KY284_026517 [Solanum tuberosum]